MLLVGLRISSWRLSLGKIDNLFLASISLALVGCNEQVAVSDTLCSTYSNSTWPATYLGAMEGQGKIDFGELSSITGEGTIRVIVTQPVSKDDVIEETVVLRLEGLASCENAQLTANFGASAGQNRFFKVIGGKMVGRLDPALGFDPYGSWEMNLVHLESLDIFSVSGSWSIDPEQGGN